MSSEQRDELSDVGEKAEEGEQLRAFVSYSRADLRHVQNIVDSLAGDDLTVDFDISDHDPSNVKFGISAEDDWWARLQEMILESDVVVFMVSDHSIASKVCDEEIAYAQSLNKRIIPVLVSSIEYSELPPKLAALNIKFRITDEQESQFDANISALRRALKTDVRWLRQSTAYLGRAETWSSDDQTRDKLLIGEEIRRAEIWATQRPPAAPPPSAIVLEWLAQSRTADTERNERRKAEQRTRQRLQFGLSIITLIAFIVTIAGAWGVLELRAENQIQTSRILADKATNSIRAGDADRAIRLAAKSGQDGFLETIAPEADQVLRALSITLFSGGNARSIESDQEINFASYADRGEEIITATIGGEIAIWSNSLFNLVHVRSFTPSAYGSIEFNRASGKIFLISENRVVRTLNLQGEQISEVSDRLNIIEHLQVYVDTLEYCSRVQDFLIAHHDNDIERIRTAGIESQLPQGVPEKMINTNNYVTDGITIEVETAREAAGHCMNMNVLKTLGNALVANEDPRPLLRVAPGASNNGTLLFFEGGNELWNTSTQTKLGPAYDSAQSVEFSSDGESAVSLEANGVISLWRFDPLSGVYLDRKVIDQRSLGDDLTAIAINTDGSIVAAGNASGEIGVWQATSIERDNYEMWHRSAVHIDIITSIQFFENQDVLASSSMDGSIRLWSLSDGREVVTLMDNGRPIFGIDVHPERLEIISWNNSQKVRVWKLSDRELVNPTDYSSLEEVRQHVCSRSPSENAQLITARDARENPVLGGNVGENACAVPKSALSTIAGWIGMTVDARSPD